MLTAYMAIALIVAFIGIALSAATDEFGAIPSVVGLSIIWPLTLFFIAAIVLGTLLKRFL